MELLEAHTTPPSGKKGAVIATALIAFIIGFGVSWLYTDRKESAQEQMTKKEGVFDDTAAVENKPIPKEASPAAEILLSIDNQSAGNKVMVARAVVPEALWVVIHEERDGKPGSILGARRFQAGQSSGEVELLRSTKDGGTYYGMLHRDDGDRKFDHTKDLPFTNESGRVIMTKFTAVK